MVFDKIRSIKDYAGYWAQIEASISRRDKPFPDDSPKAIQGRKRSAEKSIWEMGRIYFPDYVRDVEAGFHSRWENLARITDEPVLVEALRGTGKSTFFSFLDPIHVPISRPAPSNNSHAAKTTKRSRASSSAWKGTAKMLLIPSSMITNLMLIGQEATRMPQNGS